MIDFITLLPIFLKHGWKYQHIIIVVDHLSKKKKFILLDFLEVEAIVQTFIEWIWREKDYPCIVTLNKSTQFTSHLWCQLCQKIGTKPKMSTIFHPKTDGQIENTNSVFK